MITYIDLYRVLYPTAMQGDCVFTFFHMCRFVLYVSLQQIGKLNWRAKFQTVNRYRSLSFTLHAQSKYSVSTPLWRNRLQFHTSHTSICSTDLKFQYDTSIGKLNWRAKFQTVNRCRSLSFTLHVPSKYSVSTLLWRNRPQFHTRAYFYLFDWPEISVWYFNWQVKLTCKVSDSCKSMSKFVFYTTCTVKIQCFYTPMTKSTPISHIAYFYLFDWPEISVWYSNWQVKLTCEVLDSKSMSKFVFYTTCTSKYNVSTLLWRNRPQFHTCAYFYLFDWPEISVWYFNWQVKLTCKVSDSKSMSKFIFYTTCTVKVQCFYTPMTKSTPISHIAYFYMFDWPEISV